MVSVDRQVIMESNRSLRNIKNELENLLEKGVIDDSTFETITSALPPESSLSGPLRTTAASTAAPAATPRASSAPQPQPPTQDLRSLTLGTSPPTQPQQQQQPPSYNDTPAPGLPPRAPSAADPASSRPAIAHARALYRYVASDARDLSFDRDDAVLVYEYMNHDWWMGRNQRTGLEGIFPKSYVMVDNKDFKAVPQQQQQEYGGAYGYGGPPPQQNPYNAAVPPMAVADGGHQQQQQEQQQGGGGGGKAGEYGKKFGKKLGNAAIFGAGASIGSNIVNSIF